MQKEKARLGGDRHPDLVRQLQPAAAFKTLLGEKHLHVAEQLPLIGRREPVEKRKVPRDDRPPFVRHRLTAQLPPPSLLEESEHDFSILAVELGNAYRESMAELGRPAF